MNSFYERHIFFCVNERENKACCQDHHADELRAYAKTRLKVLGKTGPGKIRVNSAGCLGRCELGPVAVVYPEGAWYSYKDKADIDEIIEKHLLNGEIVTRLQLPIVFSENLG